MIYVDTSVWVALLTEFAQASNSTYQGRLFAQDALQGLRLIDLCLDILPALKAGASRASW